MINKLILYNNNKFFMIIVIFLLILELFQFISNNNFKISFNKIFILYKSIKLVSKSIIL